MPGLALRELWGELAIFTIAILQGLYTELYGNVHLLYSCLISCFFGRIFIFFALPRAETEIPHGGTHVLASLCAILGCARMEQQFHLVVSAPGDKSC